MSQHVLIQLKMPAELSPAERLETEGIVSLSELLSLLRLCAERAAPWTP